jgi:hypothetical protein
MEELLTYNGKYDLIQTTELDENGILVVRNTQDVEPLVEEMKALKLSEGYANNGIKKGWFHVGTVPDFLVHKWKKEGFDIDRETVPSIVARLHAEHMTDFLASNKNI